VITRREESNLEIRGQLMDVGGHGARSLTFCTIPARALAVYAPLEKPKMYTLSPVWW
jgi:hypothetical protein